MIAKLVTPITVAVVSTGVARMSKIVGDDQNATGKTTDLLTPDLKVPMAGGRVLALLLIRQGLIPIHVLTAADKQTGYSSAETDITHIRLLVISESTGGRSL